MTPTDKQLAFARRLATERGIEFNPDGLDRRAVSVAIDQMLTAPKITAVPELEPRIYRPKGGDIFKVQRTRDGQRVYAKQLVQIGGRRIVESDEVVQFEFEFAPGALRWLKGEDRISEDEARAFGIRYGICCVCGTRLKDADSVQAGIGPICVTRI